MSIDNPLLSFNSARHGLLTWKKDLQSVYIDVNYETAREFGYKKIEDMIGSTDYTTPCKLSDFADIFRLHDQSVIKQRQPLKLLEVQPCVNDCWRIFITIKSPAFNESSEIVGTSAISIDVTNAYSVMPSVISKLQVDKNKSISQQTFVLCNETNGLLTKRQTECAFYLVRGKTSTEIARYLNLSARTIEHYIDQIKDQLNVQKKSHLIEKLIHLGYLNCIPESLLKKQLSIQF